MPHIVHARSRRTSIGGETGQKTSWFLMQPSNAAPPAYGDYSGYPPSSGTYPPAGTYPPPAYNATQPYGAPQPYYPPYHAPPHHGSYGAPAAAHLQYDATSGEELRTIFITGFPLDVKERELNNMLRFMPGYQASQMNWKNNQAQGFALFDTGASAGNAMAMIAHVQFDENSILRVEMARKNMFVKDDAGGAAAASNAAKRPRFQAGAYPGYPGGPPVAMPVPGGSANTTTYVASGAAGAPAVAPKGFAEVSNVGDNPPCSTLFIGNLSDDVSEAELHGLFAGQPGFRQIKVVRGARSITSFVEFEDMNTAMAVHNTMQGAILQSSNRGGIRIQYSKNPLGKRKDM